MNHLKQISIFSILVWTSFVCQKSMAQNVLDPNDPVVNYDSNNKPTPPGWMQIGKWVRTPNTDVRNRNKTWYDAGGANRYKAYIFQNISFRLMYPKTYDPTANDGKKYPLIIFFHGKGENAKAPLYDANTGLNYDNEFQLLQGPPEFDAANQKGTYDGYVLVPQITDAFYGGIQDNIMEIVKYMITNNKVDPFHIVVNGLSEGGIACWDMVFRYPAYISSSYPMSSPLGGVKSGILNDNTYISNIKFTPIWLSNGEKDVNPSPDDVREVKDLMDGYGASFRLYPIPDVGHSTWYQMWGHPYFWPSINRSYSSNPWPLFAKSKFWPGETVQSTIGIYKGFEAYEWRRNGVLIASNTNEIFVTTPGIYDARVKKNGVWSEWSHVPVNVAVKNAFRKEAEDWLSMSGVQTENAIDVGGGLNVGWIDKGDWLDYILGDTVVAAPHLPGVYTLSLRVAALSAGAQLQVKNQDGTVLATLNVPQTYGWQQWQTISVDISLQSGKQNIRIQSTSTTGFNLNWLELSLKEAKSPLPVKFVYFNASCQSSGASVALQWKTAEEVNSQRFSVQRSEDGVRWNEVGTVTAAGRSTGERSYSYLDKGAQGTSLYRIVEYDADGQQTISSIVRSACLGGREVVSLYPNPTASSSILNLTLQRGAAVSIRVVDARGAVVQQREVVLPQGTNSLSLNTSGLSKGVYSVQVRYSGEVKTLKLIKK